MLTFLTNPNAKILVLSICILISKNGAKIPTNGLISGYGAVLLLIMTPGPTS